jgi:hypothetical protein
VIARTRTRKARCQAVATVGAAELASTRLPEYAHQESGPLDCELVATHDGAHVALVAVADGGDQWWWLRWGGRLGEALDVIQIEPCDAELSHGQYADDCVLPQRHTGPHSFDLRPPASLPGERHVVSRRPAHREAGVQLSVTRVRSVGGCAGPGDERSPGMTERPLLARLHNPSGHSCGCLQTCWCRRTRLGHAIRWYAPGRLHRMPNPYGSADVPE